MLKLKTFVKKTRRNKIIKVVREHYLRDDLGCGVESCSECDDADVDDGDDDDDKNGKQTKSILSIAPKSKSDLFPMPHLIVLVNFE